MAEDNGRTTGSVTVDYGAVSGDSRHYIMCGIPSGSSIKGGAAPTYIDQHGSKSFQ